MHSEHGDGHIGNTFSMSASAYQGNAFIHLPRRPLRALGCGPEAMVLVEQNNSSSLPIWLDTKHSTLQVLSNEHASSERRFGVLIRVAHRVTNFTLAELHLPVKISVISKFTCAGNAMLFFRSGKLSSRSCTPLVSALQTYFAPIDEFL